jgi:two-component system sensor histidine kinase KdpD
VARRAGPLPRALAQRAPALDILEVGRADSARRLSRTPLNTPRADDDDHEKAPIHWPGYAWATATSVALTLLCTPLASVLELSNIVMLFLLGVVGVAMRFGRGPSALAALLNVAAFDYFFVPPRLSFAVSDVQYVLTFAIMLGVGLLVGQLTAGLRFAAGVSTSRERRARSLFELTRELSAALESTQVVTLGAAAVQGHFGGHALVLVTDAADQLVLPTEPPEGFDAQVADWAFRHGQPQALRPPRWLRSPGTTCRCRRRCACAACWRCRPRSRAGC